MADWRRLSWSDRLAWVIGTGCGAGFSPIAPGTVGSLAAVGLPYLLLLTLPEGQGTLLLALLAAGGFIAGVWATGRMATAANPDPGTAVWDEFVGMWITLLPVLALGVRSLIAFPWLLERSDKAALLFLPMLAMAFISFRVMDILKPWPCRQLERLPGGWGIMLDDVAAGVWAALLTIALSLMLLGVWAASLLAD